MKSDAQKFLESLRRIAAEQQRIPPILRKMSGVSKDPWSQ
jgi:hypothetical protein